MKVLTTDTTRLARWPRLSRRRDDRGGERSPSGRKRPAAASVADLIVAQEQARLGTRDGTSALPAQTSAPQSFDWRDAWIGIGAVLLLSALLAAGVRAGGRRSRTAGAC